MNFLRRNSTAEIKPDPFYPFDPFEIFLNEFFKTEFNGGNKTGSVYIDPSLSASDDPSLLAKMSSVPHQVRGRYLFRVDEKIQKGGCTNITEPCKIFESFWNFSKFLIKSSKVFK